MKVPVATFLVSGLVLIGCGKKESTPPAKPTNSTSSGNPLTAPVDYLGAVGQAKRTSEKVADTASLNQAIQIFQASEDRYPKDLNELVTSGYLPALPKQPYGMKFQYDPKTGQVSVVRTQ